MLNNNDLLNLIDIEKVLHQLLLQIRTSTSSDAGTIYLKNGDCLKFCVFQKCKVFLSYCKTQFTYIIKKHIRNERRRLH